jgi:NAD dependent epimerase/dehydratase family enzyme
LAKKTVAEHNVIINLAGKSIFTYWTQKAKKQIYDSRILTTRTLAESLAGALDIIFFSTSAVGYYGDHGDDMLAENAPPGDDFLSAIGRDWEHEALKAQTDSIRVVLTRFGIVLGRGGGAMASDTGIQVVSWWTLGQQPAMVPLDPPGRPHGGPIDLP